MLTLDGKFILAGSNKNWQVFSRFSVILSKEILFLVMVQSCLNSGIMLFLISLRAGHSITMWKTVSSVPELQIRHRAEPPDCSDLIEYVK